MAVKLVEHLLINFHGCSEEQHAEARGVHYRDSGNNHHDLSATSVTHGFPDVLQSDRLLTKHAVDTFGLPTPLIWAEMFCGTERTNTPPMNICLHEEETPAVAPGVAFDVDSFLGFATNLGFARQGIRCQFAPQMKQNIAADLHLEAPRFNVMDDDAAEPRVTASKLMDIPHYLFGRVVGAPEIELFIFFPHLPHEGAKFVAMTDSQLARWTDRVLLPAVGRYTEAHVTQHLPASFDHARAAARARQTEGRQVQSMSYASQQALGYQLPPEQLSELWAGVHEELDEDGSMRDFREPMLFFSAKNTKLAFKRPSLQAAMHNFAQWLETVIDRARLVPNQFFIDIGKEVCPSPHGTRAAAHSQMDERAQVLLWRRCCLEEFMTWMYDNAAPAVGGKGQQYFNQNMLRDACSLTSVAPKRSRHRRGGLVYSQLYSSVKEISDASKQFPFANDGLEELALDPSVRQAARETVRGRQPSLEVVKNAYIASKRRAMAALVGSVRKSFGLREEHRVSVSLFDAIFELCDDYEDDEDHAIPLDDCPTHAWAVDTSTYLLFLRRTANKYAAGFEIVHATCARELVTWEQTKIMAMFLRCLRFVFGGHLLRRESALWWSRRQRHIGEPPRLREWVGLGFCNTLPRYGYCWIEPRIDWARLQFTPAVTDHVLFGNDVLKQSYRRRRRFLTDFMEPVNRVDLAVAWLEKYRTIPEIRTRLVAWISHLCLEQFRLDVLACVEGRMVEHRREEAMLGTNPFCHAWLSEVLASGVHLVSGNRSDFKSPALLAAFLFDFDDEVKRNHWEDRPFRVVYQRAIRSSHKVSRGLALEVEERVRQELFRYHWILPYPFADGLMRATKAGQKMWYSCTTDAGAPSRTSPSQWDWGKKEWQSGSPPPIPDWLRWEKAEWEDWVRQRVPAGRQDQR